MDGVPFTLLEEPEKFDCEVSMTDLPYVTAALICEKVLQEKDGVLSAIRLVDRIDVKIQTNDPNVKLENLVTQGINLAGLVSIKSGPFKGKGTIVFDGEGPSGKIKHLGRYDVDLQGEDHGQNVVINLVLLTQEDGLHWFNVRFNEVLLTRVPIRVSRVLERADVQTTQPPNTQ